MQEQKSQIKVLELIDTYYPTVDGAINAAKYYCSALSKVSEVKLAVPKAAKKAKHVDKEPFEVIRCASTPAPEGYRLGFPDQDTKFIKRIKDENFDIYHAHSPFALGRFALKMAKKQGIPIVATLHTQYHQDFERVVKNQSLVDVMVGYIMKLYHNADSVWTVSDGACQILRDYGYTGKIEVVRNGTHFKYPDNAEELIERVNQLHGLNEQQNVFLFVGRMAWYKNLKIIIDALSQIKQKRNDFKMLFVGGGFDLDDVKKYAVQAGIMDNCIFTGTINDNQLLQGYYLRSDLFLFPSTFDTSSVVKVEAAAHNLAAVLVKDSCASELVVDGVNGFLAQENAQSFAEKILSVMDKPELVKEVGKEAGRTLYRSWDMVAEEVKEKYLKVIEEYKRNQELFERLFNYKSAKKKSSAKKNTAEKNTAKKPLSESAQKRKLAQTKRQTKRVGEQVKRKKKAQEKKANEK